MNQYQAFIDGGSRGNPGSAASAFSLSCKNEQGEHRHYITKGESEGIQTNNMAEYLALSNLVLFLMGLRQGPMVVDVFCDSLLVVNQVNGVWRSKDKTLSDMKDTILYSARASKIALHLKHIPREKNTEADKAVNRVLDQVADLKKAGHPIEKVVSEWDQPLTCTAAEWDSKFFTNL